jgi:hypothetical protein
LRYGARCIHRNNSEIQKVLRINGCGRNGGFTASKKERAQRQGKKNGARQIILADFLEGQNRQSKVRAIILDCLGQSVARHDFFS